MGLRPAKCYADIKKRPYTRVAVKKPRKNYIGTKPAMKIRQFYMGNYMKKFPYVLYLVSKEAKQIRDNSIEAARVTMNRILQKKLGREKYSANVAVYPHQVLRETKRSTGAGADRTSKGMKKAFGKPIGRAVRVFNKTKIFSVGVEKEGIQAAKIGMKKALSKLGINAAIEIREVKLTEEDIKKNIEVTEKLRQKLLRKAKEEEVVKAREEEARAEEEKKEEKEGEGKIREEKAEEKKKPEKTGEKGKKEK